MKKMLTLLLALILILSMSGCGAQRSETTDNANGGVGTVEEGAPEMPATDPSAPPSGEKDETGGFGSDGVVPGTGFIPGTGQKIIFQSNISLETENFDETLSKLDIKVKETGAYIESSGINGTGKTDYDLRYASYVIRVPSAKFDYLKKAAEDWGTIINSNTASQDVTKQYIDTEARVKTLKLQEERLLLLLGKAVNLEDIIVLEGRLSDIRLQIESYTGTLQELSALVDYATITVTIQEVKSETFVPENFGQRLLETIRDSFITLGRYIESGLLGIIYLLPFILVLAVLVVIIRKTNLVEKVLRRKGKKETDSETLNKR